MSNAFPEFVNPYSWESATPSAKGGREEHFLRRLQNLQNAFREATGWEIQWRRPKEKISVGIPPSVVDGERLRGFSFSLRPSGGPDSRKESGKKDIPSLSPNRPAAKSKQAVLHLAEEMAELLEEIDRLQQTLWEREAELATGVPVVADFSDRKNLAARLQAVLRAGVEVVGADAAGLYLLDEATTCLKLRSVWGLPIQKLADPPRPLRGALADLEALLGHAVVLEDLAHMPSWQSPEEGFGAAVCVPVSTETTLLGTVWFFSKHPRDFSSQQVNMLEVVAGRIATDLEREVLLADAVALKPWKDHLYQLQQWHEEQVGWTVPYVEGWEIGLWKESGQAGWGEFFQHFLWTPDGVGLALGRVEQEGLRAVLEAVRVRSVLQAHAEHFRQPHRLIQQAHQTFGACSGNECQVSLWVGKLGRTNRTPQDHGELCYAAGGRIGFVLVTPTGWKSLRAPTAWMDISSRHFPDYNRPSGKEPTEPVKEKPRYRSRRHRIRRGDTLILFPAPGAPEADRNQWGFQKADPLMEMEARLAEHLRAHLAEPAPRLAELAQNFLRKTESDPNQVPKSLYVLKLR